MIFGAEKSRFNFSSPYKRQFLLVTPDFTRIWFALDTAQKQWHDPNIDCQTDWLRGVYPLFAIVVFPSETESLRADRLEQGWPVLRQLPAAIRLKPGLCHCGRKNKKPTQFDLRGLRLSLLRELIFVQLIAIVFAVWTNQLQEVVTARYTRTNLYGLI